MRIIKIVLFAAFCCFIGALAFRYSVESVFTYKQPIQGWVNTLKQAITKTAIAFDSETRIIPENQLKLIYTYEVKAKLIELRDSTLSKGVLTSDEKEKLAGKLIVNNDTIEVEFRLKGNLNDHRNTDRWSYRIYSKQTPIYGLNTFSIQAPHTREGLYEWYFHKLLLNEGFIGLNYSFIEFNDNDRVTNVFAVEEDFDEVLLTRNNRQPGVLLKFNENILTNSSLLDNQPLHYATSDLFFIAPVHVYKEKRMLKDIKLREAVKQGKELLIQFRNKQVKLNEAFDVEQTAKLFALVDMLGAHHGLMWKNVRFYYNSETKLLELIAHDACPNFMLNDIMYNRWRKDKLFGFHATGWYGLFFSNQDFLKYYYKHLSTYASKSFLARFNSQINSELSVLKTYLQDDKELKNFTTEDFITNAELVKQKLSELFKPRNGLAHLIELFKEFDPTTDKTSVYGYNYSFDTLKVVFEIREKDKVLSLLPRMATQPAIRVKIDEFDKNYSLPIFKIISRSDSLKLDIN